MTKEEIITTINRFLELIRANNIPFKQVYLYGSYVNGNPDEDSDIDLAIVADQWQPDIFEAQFELMKIGRKIDTRLEPHPFCESDFDVSNPYVREIITTGKLLY